jgi:hypothetical protein
MRVEKPQPLAVQGADRPGEPTALRGVLRLQRHGPPRVDVPAERREGDLPERRVLQDLRGDDASRAELRAPERRCVHFLSLFL